MTGTVFLVAAASAVGFGAWAGGLPQPANVRVPLALSAATAWLLAAAALALRRYSLRESGATSRYAAGTLVLLALAAGGAAAATWRSHAAVRALLPQIAVRGDDARVCGTVYEVKPRSAVVAVTSVRVGGVTRRVRERARVSTAIGPPGPFEPEGRPGAGRARRTYTVRPGESICASGTVRPGRPGRDEPPLVASKRVDRRGVAAPIRWAAGVVRERFSRAATSALTTERAGLLLGMTDGDTRLLSEKTLEDFRTTGLAHLVAVSGSNVAVVLALVMAAVRTVVTRGRLLRAAMCLPPLAFFAFLTGLEPSVLRAVVTAGLVVSVGAWGRPAEGIRVASGAFILLVLVSPDLVGRVGFQLSFAATLGLLVWAQPLAQRLEAAWPWEPGKPAQAVCAAVATTLAAQAAVAPLLALHFGQIPALGGVANLLVAPLAPVVMLGGMGTLSVASLVPALGWLPAALGAVLETILWTGRSFARLPAATVGIDVGGGLALAAAAAAALGRTRRVRVAALAVALIAGAAAAGGASVRRSVTCRGPQIRAIDVGQGTAVLLRDQTHAVLVDGGARAGGVTTRLRDAGLRSIDAVVMSHPHADHVEAEADVLDQFEVDVLIGPSTMGWGVGEAIVAAARRTGTEAREAAAGDVFRFGSISLEVLSPAPGPPPERSDDVLNAWSLVLRAEVGGIEAILPGDVGAGVQAELTGPALDADVLVAPHHGSADVEATFVESVSPVLTLVTVGENRYGHPTSRALRMFSAQGEVFRTDRHGDVVVCSAPDGMTVTTQRQ